MDTSEPTTRMDLDAYFVCSIFVLSSSFLINKHRPRPFWNLHLSSCVTRIWHVPGKVNVYKSCSKLKVSKNQNDFKNIVSPKNQQNYCQDFLFFGRNEVSINSSMFLLTFIYCSPALQSPNKHDELRCWYLIKIPNLLSKFSFKTSYW